MKKYLFPFFFLFTLFSDEIFRSYLSARDMLVGEGMYQQMYVIIAIISYCILFYDLFSAGRLRNRVVRFFIILCSIVALFCITYLLYSGGSPGFISSVLHFGSVCMSAAACGMHLALTRPWKVIDGLLPYFLLAIGISVGLFGMRTLMVSIITEKEVPLDYQTVSYFMAELFGFSSYYLFFSSKRKSTQFKLVKWPLLALMIFAMGVVVISGGRGGFVLLGVELFVLLILLLRTKRIKKSRIVPLVILGIVAFSYFASTFSIFDTDGFTRISTSLGEDDNRKELYNIAWKSYLTSPILGHGLGSVWMEVGFYCHNMLLDLLVEAGALGAGMVLFFYYKTGINLWRWQKKYPYVVFLLFAFLKVVVMTLFSGYWLNALQLWLVFGFVYIASAKKYWILTVDNKQIR